MKRRRGTGIIESLIAFVGLALLGIAGYNVARTGCPLGWCGPCDSVCAPADAN
ncbi:MAG: hypothetical protein JNK25_09260 [Phycisphaerae bacterium]|nr:hypothetical protein [Phycisphaerae bacterium]